MVSPNMRWYFDKTPAGNVDDVITRCSPRALASPHRSTVPLLSLLKHQAEKFTKVAAHLGLNEPPTGLHFEFTVEPPRGSGNASHTDAMAVTSDRSLAIEAKWTEPRYETTRRWLDGGGNGSNRRLVVEGWTSLLDRCVERPLDIDHIMELPYQLIHRAASACSAGLRPALMYLQFFPQPGDRRPIESHVRDDLRTLHEALGSPARFPFFVLEVEAQPTESFAAIAHLPKGSTTTGSAVIDALLDGRPLFEFPEWTCDSI